MFLFIIICSKITVTGWSMSLFCVELTKRVKLSSNTCLFPQHTHKYTMSHIPLYHCCSFMKSPKFGAEVTVLIFKYDIELHYSELLSICHLPSQDHVLPKSGTMVCILDYIQSPSQGLPQICLKCVF